MPGLSHRARRIEIRSRLVQREVWRGGAVEALVCLVLQFSVHGFHLILGTRRGCVTPAILQQLAVLVLDRIPGFKRLR